MKMLYITTSKLLTLTALSFTPDLLWAQDSSQSSAHTVAAESTGFTVQPWMWVVAIAVLVLVVINILKTPPKAPADKDAVVRNMDGS